MMLALGIARDLGADDARRVGLARRPANPPDALPVDALDLERAGARAIMRANAGQDVERQDYAPPRVTVQNISTGRPGRYGGGCGFRRGILDHRQGVPR